MSTSSNAALDLYSSPIDLTRQLVDVESPSHHEKNIADLIEAALRSINDIRVDRHDNTIVARTQRGLSKRVLLAGHIDTVPIADNVPSTLGVDKQGREVIFGCGSVDMKSGLAVYLHTFAKLAHSDTLTKDLTLVCYEGEEVSSEFNGLGHIEAAHPQWLEADVALLGEPTGSVIEAGCQGSIRLKVIAHGERAHSARSWLGTNAMHVLAPVISNIAHYQQTRDQEIEVDGCLYHEGLNIVHMESGVATNTIPDHAWMFVNFRFAPHRSVDEALEHMLSVLDLPQGVEYLIDDAVPGARPGLDQPVVAELINQTGGVFRAKYGWTDVARFSALKIPAVNFGPGDPAFCHKKDEQCPVAMIDEVATVLSAYLTS
ncbi:succinyl-diaminopimelate desuccinylase [Corynebacterium sp. sy017]|uniref:succinyl-diaminopimelate desuccinylase n=1 Tax=unclassified Corynebacterium TaxID=2624378 RepID=UPI001184904C|nr:succinyl-diaminopimelate desuccinylase [Corynebacterium sp. SY003]MBP3088955.1 succinyl-diaminopimelate desuccinylase [Corynebacterium sp. sy017]TSD91281.1 succinyl-diaminopimelate desuccinylase [Corynebacterium sp. SY003]